MIIWLRSSHIPSYYICVFIILVLIIPGYYVSIFCVCLKVGKSYRMLVLYVVIVIIPSNWMSSYCVVIFVVPSDIVLICNIGLEIIPSYCVVIYFISSWSMEINSICVRSWCNWLWNCKSNFLYISRCVLILICLNIPNHWHNKVWLSGKPSLCVSSMRGSSGTIVILP